MREAIRGCIVFSQNETTLLTDFASTVGYLKSKSAAIISNNLPDDDPYDTETPDVISRLPGHRLAIGESLISTEYTHLDKLLKEACMNLQITLDNALARLERSPDRKSTRLNSSH